MFSLLQDLLDDQPHSYSNFGVYPCGSLDLSPSIYYRVARPRCYRINPSSSARTNLNKFKMMMNVKLFRPEEIEVTIIDDCVLIHGKHEEQADENGYVSREFTRRCKLPVDVDPEAVKCTVNQNGVLTIQAPRKQLQPPPSNEWIVPINFKRSAGFGELPQQPAQPQGTEEQQPAQPQGTEGQQPTQPQGTEEQQPTQPQVTEEQQPAEPQGTEEQQPAQQHDIEEQQTVVDGGTEGLQTVQQQGT